MSRSAPIVLGRFVRADEDIRIGLNPPKPKPKQTASRPLSCVSRRAIGVSRSNDADKALNHLLLETHLADAPALSRLTLGGKAGIRHMVIYALDYKLIILGSRLPIGDTNFSPLTSQVYLVYDAVEQSITMIPSHPWLKTPQQPGEMRKTAASSNVLIARPPGSDGRSYALVHMAETTINYGRNHSSVKKEDVLYVWRSWTSSCQWDRITTSFPTMFKGQYAAHSFSTVLAFSCGGRAFWVNLLCGIMYCSLDALLFPSNGDTKLEFHFIRLPDKLPREITEDLMGPMEMNSAMFRTMGRAGESSIKFVTIDGFAQLKDFVDCTVRVWSRSLDHDMTTWTERSLSLGSIAEQDEFKTAGVPKDMVPMYPSLSPEEEDIVYFMLGKYDPCCYDHEHFNSKERCKAYAITAGKAMYQLRVDMRHGVLLSSARLPDQTSPSVIVADSSVVPSPMVPSVMSALTILEGSTGGRKAKRSRSALHKN